MIKKLSVFDLDGVLIDSTKRYRTMVKDGKEMIDLDYWRENEHKAFYADRLLPLAHGYFDKIMNDKSVYVVLATARVLNEPDRQFIREILGFEGHIISRKNGDNRSGGLLKVLGLRKLLALAQFKNLERLEMFEDNHTYLKTICDAFRDRGMRGYYIASEQGH